MNNQIKFIFFLLGCIISLQASAQMSAESITGSWLKTPKEDMIIDVYNSNGKYEAKIKWAKDSVKWPIGFVILKNLAYDPGKMIWKDGTITAPSSNNKYDASLQVNADGRLELFAYKGIKLFGKTKYFRKVK